jgi:hypothetical protein
MGVSADDIDGLASDPESRIIAPADDVTRGARLNTSADGATC